MNRVRELWGVAGWILLVIVGVLLSVEPGRAQEPTSDEAALFAAWKKEIQRKEEAIGKRLTAPPRGESYDVECPDTLDLADRASLAVNCLTGALNPDHGYELYFVARFCVDPPFMHHEASGLPTNNPKFAESLPMMRLMSGSRQSVDVEQGMMLRMLALVHDDGLYYAPLIGRPWHHTWHRADDDFANVYGNGRWLLALMAWHEYDGNPLWKEYAAKVVEGLHGIARVEGDEAYFPDPKIGESFSYPKSGYAPNLGEPTEGSFGIPMYFSGVIRGLAKWARLTGDRDSLELAQKLSNFVRRPEIWRPEAGPSSVSGPERGHFSGHFHAHVAALRGLLEYAIVANDAGLKEFVRNGYEYARGFGISRIGWFPENAAPLQHCESCCVADMVALAVKLSDAGVGEYWEDVDRYVRNQLVEQQFVSQALVEQCSAAGPPHDAKPPRETNDRVIERNLGGFAGHGDVTTLPNAWIMHCCTGNATQALYYAWEGIVRDQGHGTATVNLLLNRASPWLDVESDLPYEGKVLIRNKTAERMLIRIPNWVSREEVQCSVDAANLRNEWIGNYLVVGRLTPEDRVTIEFPIVEETFQATLDGATHTMDLRGNTVVRVSSDQPFRIGVQDGRLSLPGPGMTKAVAEDVKGTDLTVRVDACQNDAEAGIILRYADADNFLLANYANGSIYFHEVVDGAFGHPCDGKAASDLDGPLHLTADVRGDQAHFSVSDGSKTYEAKHTITNARLRGAGRVGLFHNRTAGQWYDTFHVSSTRGQTVFEDQFHRPEGEASGWEILGVSSSLGYPIYQRDHMRRGKAPRLRKRFYVLKCHIEG